MILAVEEQMERIRDLLVEHIESSRVRNLVLQMLRVQFTQIWHKGAMHGIEQAREVHERKWIDDPE